MDHINHSLLVYFQAGYENFSELKEPIIQEVEEATARGELVRSARRFVEELANSRVPYARRVEYLMGQVRLAQGMDDHNWLRRAAEVANDQGFRNYQWICDHICHIPPRRGNNRSRRAANINENFSTTPVKDYRLQVDPSIQLRVSDAQRDVSPPMTQEEEDDLLASSPDISISEPVVDESDSVLQSTPAPSSTEDAGSRDEKATGWRLISAEKQLFRVPAEEVSRSCGGIRDSSSEPQGRSRGRHQTAGRQRRRQEASVRQPRREDSRREKRGTSTRNAPCREVLYNRRQEALVSRTMQPRHEEARRRQEEPVCRPVRPQYKDDRRRQEATATRAVQPRHRQDSSNERLIRPLVEDFYRSRSTLDGDRRVEARGRGMTIQLPTQTTTVEQFINPDCPVATCDQAFVRSHCFEEHLPPVFHEELSGVDITNRRLGVLRSVMRLILGVGRTFSDLMVYLETQGVLNLVDPVITRRQRVAMEEFANATGYTVPNHNFIHLTGNSPALLTHWAVVSLLVSSLESHQRDALIDQFPLTRRELDSLQDAPEGFDTCCQYDKLAQDLGFNLESDPRLVFARAQAESGFEVDLKSALLVFSNPDAYPTKDQIRQFRAKGFYVALGARPKSDASEAQLNHLAELLEMPEVSALGEIGVDHSVPIQYWARQTVNIQKLLGCLSIRAQKVLVVKCRGVMGEDPSEAYDILRTCLHQFVPGVQLIHLHCFDGDNDVVSRWLQSFPFTYFSFARIVDNFEEGQRDALRQLDDARLLLETNSPYIKFGGGRASTPAQIGMAARAIAAIRGGTWRRVLAVATRNAHRLYAERLEPQCDWGETQGSPFARRH